MREIKFRGIASCDVEMYGEADIAEGQMIFGQLIFDRDTPFIVGKIAEQCEEYVSLEWWCPIRPETLGQFTGLKDANEIEIYEGDIVRWGDAPKGERGHEIEVRIATVRISPDIQFDCQNIKHPHVFDYGSFAYQDTGKYLTVIGNIHLNPELLAK